jgi:hypothetical protein
MSEHPVPRRHTLDSRSKSAGHEEDDANLLRKARLERRFAEIKSTEAIHADANDTQFYGAYGHLRKCLDYNHHVHYKKQRQWLHDAIIEDSLFQESDWSKEDSELPTSSLWLILAVGDHGVGKHYVMKDLITSERLPLLSFVCIDPGVYDESNRICTRLPFRGGPFTN